MAEVEVPRDRWGKPLIIPPGGGKPVAYSRASSFGDALDDTYNLEQWKLRMVVHGIGKLPHLFLAATVTPLENKARLNEIAREAIEHAGGGAKASIGTSLHALTEMYDRGLPVPEVPQYAADLVAYKQATAGFDFLSIEEFMVCDELRVAGTPDRIGYFNRPGPYFICDLKTGSNGNYLGRHASQLAIYAHSDQYDPATGERLPLFDLSQEVGYIFHAPAGEGICNVYEVDLVAGWEAALLAAKVRDHRKRVNKFVKPISTRKAVA